jgi:hypothetical protein
VGGVWGLGMCAGGGGIDLMGYCDRCVFTINSNTGLCLSAKVSFICCLCLLRYRSSVLSNWPLFLCAVP